MEGKKISVNPRMIKRDIIRHWPIWVMASIWYMLFVCFVNAASRYSFSMIDADKKISEKIMISLTENTAFLSYFLGLAIAIAAFGFLGICDVADTVSVYICGRDIPVAGYGFCNVYGSLGMADICDNHVSLLVFPGGSFYGTLWKSRDGGSLLFWFYCRGDSPLIRTELHEYVMFYRI